jgi:hypothetical protein
MIAFLAAVLVAVGIGVGASVMLESYQATADSAFVSQASARIDPEPKLRGPQKPKS